MWLTTLIEIGYHEDKVTALKMDNQSALAMAKQESSSERTKHIDVRYHYLKFLVLESLLKLEFVSTEESPIYLRKHYRKTSWIQLDVGAVSDPAVGGVLKRLEHPDPVTCID